MKAADRGEAHIFIGEETKLYIFSQNKYYLTGEEAMEIHLPSYKHKYFLYNLTESYSEFEEKIDYYKNQGYPYIHINIFNMNVAIENTATVSRLKNINRLIHIAQRMTKTLIQYSFWLLGLKWGMLW